MKYLPLTNTELSLPPFLSLVMFISTYLSLIFPDCSTYFLDMSDNLALVQGVALSVVVRDESACASYWLLWCGCVCVLCDAGLSLASART